MRPQAWAFRCTSTHCSRASRFIDSRLGLYVYTPPPSQFRFGPLNPPFPLLLGGWARCPAGTLDTLRRYDISYVMRSGRARGLPTSYCQADLDLLHPAGGGGGGGGGAGGHPDKGRLLAEAEAVKAVTQAGSWGCLCMGCVGVWVCKGWPAGPWLSSAPFRPSSPESHRR